MSGLTAGDRLSNGAICLDETVFQKQTAENQLQRSIVFAMIPGHAYSPYVTWDRMVDSSGLDSYGMGHYHQSIADGFKEYEKRCEAKTSAKANEEAIKERAQDDARAAASWFFDGNTSQERLKEMLQGIDDGDPAYMDQVPAPRVVSELAADPTWEDIMLQEVSGLDPQDGDEGARNHPQYDELLTLYEDTYSEKIVEFIYESAQNLLGEKV